MHPRLRPLEPGYGHAGLATAEEPSAPRDAAAQCAEQDVRGGSGYYHAVLL